MEEAEGGGSSIINAFRSAIIIGATNARQTDALFSFPKSKRDG